jgi:type IV pilus assembly protein PilO
MNASEKKSSGLSFRQIQEDFRCLSNSDPGTWLPIPKLVVLLVVLVLVVTLLGWYFWSDKLTELNDAQVAEETLKAEYADKKLLVLNLDAYRVRLEEVKQSFGALLKQLPDRTEVDALLKEVNQAGLGRGLRFEQFVQGVEERRDFYVMVPMTVRVNGVYHDLGAFAADVAKLARIVTLNNISITPEAGTGKLFMNMQLRTFRYLTEEEQQQAQGGKK